MVEEYKTAHAWDAEEGEGVDKFPMPNFDGSTDTVAPTDDGDSGILNFHDGLDDPSMVDDLQTRKMQEEEMISQNNTQKEDSGPSLELLDDDNGDPFDGM